MKKVVACVLLSCVAASLFLVAQDPKLKLQARTKMNLVTVYPDDEDLNEGISFTGDDEFGVSYSLDYAGVYISLKGRIPEASVSIYDYYGWMKFGDLTLTAGEWSHRKVTTLDKDGSSFGGLWDLEYGVLDINADEEGFIETLAESDNITPWKVEAAADYSFGAVQASIATGSDSKDSYNVLEQCALRLSGQVTDDVTLTAAGIMNGKDLLTAGAFVEFVPFDSLSMVVGYSGYHDLDVSENSRNALELRGVYKMNELSLASHNNATLGDDVMILYNMLNLAYKVSDLMTPCIMVANTHLSGDAVGTEGNLITARPGLTVSPGKGATIDAGVRFEYFSPDSGDSITRISVPVVFRVKL